MHWESKGVMQNMRRMVRTAKSVVAGHGWMAVMGGGSKETQEKQE